MGVRGDMEPRGSLRRTSTRKSAMVPTSYVYESPLLPFEKQLIESIGATEEEYRHLVSEAINKGKVRPAGYEHIPDIQAGTAAAAWIGKFAVQLAIGIAIGYVTYLLTPKPKQPKVQRRELDSINKAGRFNPTFGFDSQAELAAYGEPISLVFGDAQYEGETYLGGGMLISPKLVWSRMFSYGTQQAVKLAFIVGEQGKTNNGIDSPLLSGVFLGTNPLDSIYSSSFAFYWCRHSKETTTGSRITTDHFRYGSRGNPEDGDPDTIGTGDRVILCPTNSSNADTGFSAVHSLSNNAEFGCYAPIANGSGYKVNWQVVSWIKVDPGTDDPGDVKQYTVKKISGNTGWDTGHRGSNRWNGMPGTGRWYSRRMGIRFFHGEASGQGTITCSNAERTKVISNVRVGDKIEFYITPSGDKIRGDLYGDKVKVDDINSEIDSQRMAADDAMQIGEIFQIGKTVWQVYNRTQDIWTDENNVLQKIWLKCIDDNNQVDNKIGIVSDGIVNPKESKGYGDDYIGDSLTIDETPQEEPGANFFPLLRRSKAIVKNTRACETTELGLRSKVNQQIAGLCNFQSLLTPDQLGKLWRDKVSITGGTITSLIKRASLFSLQWRDGEVSHTSDIQDWKDFGITFAVVGSSSVDQYNWIRIRHPSGSPHRYEYQLNPVPGAALYGKSKSDQIYILNALASEASDGPSHTIEADGFRIQFNGGLTGIDGIQKNKEFLSGELTTEESTTYGDPTVISKADFLTGKEDWDSLPQMTQAKWKANFGGTGNGPDETNIVTGYGRHGAFLWELFGGADANSPLEKEGTFDFITTKNTRNKPVRLKIKVVRYKMESGHWSGRTYNWKLLGVDDATHARRFEGVRPANTNNSTNLDWTTGDIFRVQKSCGGSNPFAQNAENGPLTYAGIEVEITGHHFVHDIIRGKELGMTDEIFGSASDDALNSTKEVQVVMTTTGSMSGTGAGWSTDIESTDSRTITVKFKGTVIDVRPHWSGRYRAWRLDSMSVVSATGEWNKGDTFNFFKTSISNADNDFWRTVQGALGYVIRIDDVATVHTPSITTAGREFESQSQYADLSFYGNLVKKSNDSSPEHTVVYVNEMLSNENLPKYDKTTTSVLALKASRNFSSLDQMRVWLKEGIRVERLHPDEGNAIGASNLFTDLVYYLFTDRTGGAGQLLGTATDAESLIDKAQLATTSKFLRANKLFFNGAIAKPINLREYISEMAPNFLCDFILADGRFSLKPSLPVNSDGEISTNAVEIKQLFTTGNILEDSFNVQYIDADERRKFKAVVRYREEQENQLPTEKTVTVRHAGGDGTEPIETFDLTDFCTTREHAELVAKYYLTLRKRVTHSCTFSTTPSGLDLGPGDFVRVTTETSPYNAANNGTVSASGVVTSVRTLEDGTYNVLYYSTSTDEGDVEEDSMQVTNGAVTDSRFHSSIFSVVNTTNSQNVYRVEQLSLNEDNIVEVVASEFPCDSGTVSLMARDIKNDANFTFVRS